MNDGLYTLGLDELLERDTSSYELYNSLPERVKKKIKKADASTFSEMKKYL